MIVLHMGKIVFEAYPRMSANDTHAHFSITKTFVSTLIAILEDKNQLDVDRSIDFYMPELKSSAWDNIKVIDILDMASGIDCREHVANAFDNPDACFNQFFRAFGWPYAEEPFKEPIEFLKTISLAGPAGEEFDYTGVNTSVLTLLVERITKRSFADVLEKEIWQKIGAEGDAFLASSPNGHSASWGGLSSNLRDLARYGLMFTPTGRKKVGEIISDDYLDKIQNRGRPKLFRNSNDKGVSYEMYRALNNEMPRHNTYQWDKVMEDGDFYKAGFGGQGLYVSPGRDLVIAFFGAQDDSGEMNELHHISRQLALSGLFD
jgi:CubicO group peptidase (beta-lactamase class C family)